MITFSYESTFALNKESDYAHWLTRVLESEQKIVGEICYVFCTDDYLFSLNKEFLKHETLTDILTFDYSNGAVISGDIFISVDRVIENARELNQNFDREMRRVMVHGLLHMLGYSDKTKSEKAEMRRIEDTKIIMFHVEH